LNLGKFKGGYMRKLILAVLFCFIFSYAYAGFWYVVTPENKVIMRSDGKPSDKDLGEEGNFAVYSDSDILPGLADYKGKKIVEHVKTATEIAKENTIKEQIAEEDLIQAEIRSLAITSLKAKGVNLKTDK